MEIKYFKKEYSGKIISCTKIADEKTLSVHTKSIEAYDSNKEHMFVNLGYEEATKEEFDNFYIEAVRNINEISRL